MSNLTNAIFAVAALSTAAEAKPHKVVVVDFDGLPRNIADAGRSNVMSLLGNEYDLVPTKKWESARANAPGRGPAQWQQASKSSGVDAVIEGFVDSSGRHHTLVVLVRDALTGNEIDSASVSIGEKGLSSESVKSLTSQLDEILVWIDPDSTSDDVQTKLKEINKPTIGSHDPKKHIEDDIEDDESREAPRRPPHRPAHPSLRHIPSDEDGGGYRDRDENPRRDVDHDEPRERRSHDDGYHSHDDRRTTRDFDDRDGENVKRSDRDRANAPMLK
ncbi:MAG TPA: hypothetical protein VF403_26680, partial [Kofleriaceae bacterium]